MTDWRFLTSDEAALLCQAAEGWLRRGAHELDLGERALRLLSRATVRPEGCNRRDIAGVNHTLEVELMDCRDLLEFTLVHPGHADALQRRVSILTPLGLSFIGQPVGAIAPFPCMAGSWNVAKLRTTRLCGEMARSSSWRESPCAP
jgi:transcription elongation GreA/GreB family factor